MALKLVDWRCKKETKFEYTVVKSTSFVFGFFNNNKILKWILVLEGASVVVGKLLQVALVFCLWFGDHNHWCSWLIHWRAQKLVSAKDGTQGSLCISFTPPFVFRLSTDSSWSHKMFTKSNCNVCHRVLFWMKIVYMIPAVRSDHQLGMILEQSWVWSKNKPKKVGEGEVAQR